MKVYNSPYNKIIKYNDKYLIFAGNTGNIKLISIKDIIKLKLKLLNNPEKQEYLKYGFILPENYKKFLLKIQGKAVKDIVKSDLSLVIIPTMLCNLKCSYCFVQKQVKNVCMSKETIDKIIHLIGANNGKYSVEWFGGEPTLSVDLMNYFYSEANKKNYINKFSLLITNGTFENNLCWDIIEN